MGNLLLNISDFIQEGLSSGVERSEKRSALLFQHLCPDNITDLEYLENNASKYISLGECSLGVILLGV